MRDQQSIKASGLRWLWISLLVFGLDYLSKLWVLEHFSLYESKPFLPSLQLTYVQNYGVAFGQLTRQNPWMLTAIAGVIMLYLLYWLYTNSARLVMENCALALIVGGAVGNLYDRVSYGYVVDFIDFYIGSWHWYVFNIADAAICVGACLLILRAFMSDKAKAVS
jgi:signal peptidase II